MSAPAVLVLEDGTVYHGEGFGASGTAFGSGSAAMLGFGFFDFGPDSAGGGAAVRSSARSDAVGFVSAGDFRSAAATVAGATSGTASPREAADGEPPESLAASGSNSGAIAAASAWPSAAAVAFGRSPGRVGSDCLGSD